MSVVPYRRALKAALPSLMLSSSLFGASASAAPLVIQEPNDPRHLAQWHLRDGAGIGAYSAWAMVSTVPQSPAVVAVIDANVELTNTELKNRLVTGWDARNNQPYPVAFLIGASMHGTMVSGVLSGEVNNNYFGAGAAGPAPVSIMPLKYVNDTDLCGVGVKEDETTLQQVFTAVKTALQYALSHNAKVINISSTVAINRPDLSPTLQALYDEVLAAFEDVSEQGILVVAAAGNLKYDADRLANEDQIAIEGWDDLTQRNAPCPSPRFRILKWESELTPDQRLAWTEGTSFALTVTDNLGIRRNVQVTARSEIRKGSVLLPAALNRAPYSYNVITVAGSDKEGKFWSGDCTPTQTRFATAMNDDLSKLLCSGSTYGSFVDIAAPAKEILVQTLGVELSEAGTSFSAPMVAGAAGLALSVRPNLTAQQLKSAITYGVDRTRIKPGTTPSATLNPNDLLNMPRMLASATIGIANPNAPTRVDVLPEPTWNSSTRSEQLTAANVVKDDGGSLVSWAWSFGDNTPVTMTTAPTVSHAFALNGSYPVALTVTDDQGNKRSFTQTFAASGNSRDLVTVQFGGASPYRLDGVLVSGNLTVRNGLVPTQHVVTGTGVVRDTSGRNVTVTFNVTTNLLGYVTTGTVNVTDPVRGNLGVTLNNGTLLYDGTIAQAVCSQSGLTNQAFTSVSFTVRDTDG